MRANRKNIVRRPHPAADVRTWMELVWGDDEGHAVLQCVPCGDDRHHASEVLAWPEQRRQVEDFVCKHRGCGRVHASPVLRDAAVRRPRAEAACRDGRVCWAEIDEQLPVKEISRRLEGIPAAIVASGGPGRHHVYVPLDERHPPADIKAGNEALRELLEGDAAQSPSKLLAVPGTLNHKYDDCDQHPTVRFITRPRAGDVVSVEELLHQIGTDDDRPPAVGQQSGSVAAAADLPSYLQDVINEPPGPKRGSQAFHAVLALMEYGLTNEGIRAIAPDIPAIAQKFEGRTESEVSRLLAKYRPDHAHEGQSCDLAGCPNLPDWMASSARNSYTPPCTLADFLDQDLTVEWMIEGLLTYPTYGMIAGPAKSFKSWIALELAFAVATGTRFLGRYPVNVPGPVLLYVNEGSEASLSERLRRLARARGVAPRRIPLSLRTDSPSCDSPAFLPQLKEDLAAVAPKLVILDAWYAFHGTGADATNLFSEGALLRRVQRPCSRAGASLMIANHFTKNAPRKLQLSSITQSGGQQWPDSWILTGLLNRTDTDATMQVAVGGRSSGEREFVLHARGGMATGVDAPFGWEVKTSTSNFEEEILGLLEDRTDGLGKVEIREQITGANMKIDAALKELLDRGRITRRGRRYCLPER